MASDSTHTPQRKPRRSDAYPMAIQEAGPNAIRVFDRVEHGLLNDGYTLEETDMLLQYNLDQILAQANLEARQEARADARRAKNEQQKRQH